MDLNDEMQAWEQAGIEAWLRWYDPLTNQMISASSKTSCIHGERCVQCRLDAMPPVVDVDLPEYL